MDPQKNDLENWKTIFNSPKHWDNRRRVMIRLWCGLLGLPIGIFSAYLLARLGLPKGIVLMGIPGGGLGGYQLGAYIATRMFRSEGGKDSSGDKLLRNFDRLFSIGLTTLLVALLCNMGEFPALFTISLIFSAAIVDWLRFGEQRRMKSSSGYTFSFVPKEGYGAVIEGVRISLIGIPLLFLVWFFFPGVPDQLIDDLGQVFVRPYQHYLQLQGAHGYVQRAQFAFLFYAFALTVAFLIVFRRALGDLKETCLIVSGTEEGLRKQPVEWGVTSLAGLFFLFFLWVGWMAPAIAKDDYITSHSSDRDFMFLLVNAGGVPTILWIVAVTGYRYKFAEQRWLNAMKDPSALPEPMAPPVRARLARSLLFKSASMVIVALFVFVMSLVHRSNAARHPSAGYGGIAYSATHGVAAIALGRPTQLSANADAVKACGLQTHDQDSCLVQLSFYDLCGALALSNGQAFGVGRGSNRETAENWAIKYCRQYGGSDCGISLSQCVTTGQQTILARDVKISH